MREEKIYYTDNGEQFFDLEEAERREAIISIQKKQAALYKEIQDLQDTCQHRHMTVCARSDTGNYCRSDDEYWYEGECRSCGERWRVDQSENSIVRDRYSKRNSDPKVIVKKS